MAKTWIRSATEREQTLAQEAAAWVFRLREEDTSVTEFADWQQWLALSDDHLRAYRAAEEAMALSAAADLSNLWPSEAEIAADVYSGEVAVADYSGYPDVPERGGVANAPQRWKMSVFASGLAATLALALLFIAGPTQFRQFFAPARIEVVTMRAENREVGLRDGSIVDVSAATDLKIDFTGKKRRIKFYSGEAYFTVAPDKARPFVVSTKLGDIIAVGTQFNVREAGDQVTVTVTEGKVRVEPSVFFAGSTETPPENLIVVAGKSVVLTRSGTADALAARPAPPLTWREGRLSYRNEPLKYVVADINRYSGRQVLISDSVVGDLRYSGTIVPKSVEEWVEALPAAFPVVVETQTGDTYVLSTN